MHFRSLRALSALTVASALVLGLAPAASAAPKDKEAEKLLKTAIDEDYLNADFPKAEKHLKEAISKCGSSGCSPELLGKIHVALGTVYGVGMNKASDAKDEFVAALKADSKAALDPSITNADLQKIFDDAKKSAGSSSGSGSGSAGPSKPPSAPLGEGHTPPPESPVNTPVPIYVEPGDDVPLSKVVLKYKPFGATTYKSVELKKLGKGWGGEIPCEDVTTTGDVKYYFAYTGTDGEAAGSLGSSKEPFHTTIKNELEGDAPRLPGKKPPDQCKSKEDCPPGLQGCPDSGGGKGGSGKHGDKGWGSSCDSSEECKEGLACLNGTCEEGQGGDGDKPDEGKKKRMNLIGLGVQFDVLSLKSTSAACDGSDVTYECFLHGASTPTQFYGVPVPFKSTDGIQGGAAFAGARILVGYDRQLVKKMGLSLGIRAGYAFGGPGSPSNAPQLVTNSTALALLQAQNRANPPQAQASGFRPLHLEARASYHILGSMMEDKKFRPYVFIGGGYGQVNASVPVAICDANVTTADPSNGTNCKVSSQIPQTILRNVDAYQVTGLGFAEFGGGTTFGITPVFGIAAELKFMVMLPTVGFVFAPNIGPVFNF